MRLKRVFTLVETIKMMKDLSLELENVRNSDKSKN